MTDKAGKHKRDLKIRVPGYDTPLIIKERMHKNRCHLWYY